MQLREDFLHYIWRFKQFNFNQLITTQGDTLHIFDFGEYNTNGGPDFLNARIQINETIWVGNIEIHVNASEWHEHRHSENDAYNNVILHVVLINDEPIYRNNNHLIPTLELKGRISLKLKNKYLKLLHEQAWIPCAPQIDKVSSFSKNTWLERVLVERLEQKTAVIASILKQNHNDWEATFYQAIARHFGLKINVTPFERIAQSLPHIILAKHKNSLFQLEALLFGQAGFLHEEFQENYPNRLKKEYQFLQHKHQLQPIPKTMWQFLRLRPPSFPTIRLAQFAALIHQSSHLFSKVLEKSSVKEIEELFEVTVSDYWLTHYVFDKTSKKRRKNLGQSAIQLLIINTIVPCLFLYGQTKSDHTYADRALKLLEELPTEKNSIIKKWQELNMETESAYQTQALLQLKKHYCDKKKCLECSIGNSIIKS